MQQTITYAVRLTPELAKQRFYFVLFMCCYFFMCLFYLYLLIIVFHATIVYGEIKLYIRI